MQRRLVDVSLPRACGILELVRQEEAPGLVSCHVIREADGVRCRYSLRAAVKRRKIRLEAGRYLVVDFPAGKPRRRNCVVRQAQTSTVELAVRQ